MKSLYTTLEDQSYYEEDAKYMQKVDTALRMLPVLLTETDQWQSLIINRRKPVTYRLWRLLSNGDRICCHCFDPCESAEAHPHPHLWPGGFAILAGSYAMTVGHSSDEISEPNHVLTTVIGPGSRYAITSPLAWHAIQPLQRCWTVMINGKPFDAPHRDAPTTKGKDLDRMSPEQLKQYLNEFRTRLKTSTKTFGSE